MKAYPPDRFYNDLPTRPVIGQKILVTGATGYIGGELVPELLARGYQVRVMVRSYSPEYQKQWPGVEVVVADARKFSELKIALKGTQCAYYLIHSLHLGNKKFLKLDNQMAFNFRKAAEENRLERIIYLGGLGNPTKALSNHLRSRFMVAEELQKGKTPVTFLRAAVIIGPGSASYKIIRYLVQNCLVFLYPLRANARCQPIAVRDVIKYLVGCLETEETAGNSYDIGGQSILTYQKMLKTQAEITGRNRIFIPSFFSAMKFYAGMASLLTPLPYRLIKSLMDSCSCDVVCQNEDIKKWIPFQPLTYTEALIKAMAHEAKRDDICAEQRTFRFDGAKRIQIDETEPAH